jgi:Phage integrase family
MTPARLDNPWQPEPFNVKMWLTRPDQRARCAEQPGYLPVGSPVDGCPTITVDASRRHQVMDGFGFAEYLRAADVVGDAKSPLFRSAVRRTGVLAATAMHRVDAWRMIQRRATDLGMKVKIGCHTFRATGITAYLEAGGTLEHAQAMAAHESPRTTKLYDRTGDEITLDEVERIAI